MTKRPAGSVSCDGQPLAVIDAAAIPERRIMLGCDCGRRHSVDVTTVAREVIRQAMVGALQLPAGNWRVVVNIGHSGDVLSAQMLSE